MHVNNELGSINPVKEQAQLCRSRGTPFHSDTVQSIGKLPVDVREIGLDLLSLSAHKIYGPKGIGALYVRRARRFWPTVLYLFVGIWVYYTFRATSFYLLHFVLYQFVSVAVLTALLGMVVGGLIALPFIWSEIKLLLKL